MAKAGLAGQTFLYATAQPSRPDEPPDAGSELFRFDEGLKWRKAAQRLDAKPRVEAGGLKRCTFREGLLQELHRLVLLAEERVDFGASAGGRTAGVALGTPRTWRPSRSPPTPAPITERLASALAECYGTPAFTILTGHTFVTIMVI